MIFLTVGNWHKGFDRLVIAVDQLIKSNVIDEEVIGQIGPGQYKPEFIKYKDFYSHDEFKSLLKEARLIISHAGMGTIGQSIQLLKPIIVVPRKAELGEHFDNHQIVTTKYMESEGKVLAAFEINDLIQKIHQSDSFVPNQGYGSKEIINIIRDFIDKLEKKCR